MAKSKLNNNDSHGTDDKENEWINTDDILSDESSFYGDAETKLELENRVTAYNPKEHWDVVRWNVQRLVVRVSHSAPRGVKREREDSEGPVLKHFATKGVQTNETHENAIPEKLVSTQDRPYNPFEGELMAKQLNETADDFLTRLKPSSTIIATGGPWIWVANPFSTHRPSGQDIATFKELGSQAMNDYLLRKAQCEAQFPNKTAGGITRMLKRDRDTLEARIVQLAKEKGVTCGKWMLFPFPEQVDKVWATVTKAVAGGQLGCSAKVATDDRDPKNKQRLVCIYTDDFSDTRDVKRVLGRMQELGLIRAGEMTIYYKADAFTYLDIMSDNEYKLKASMYNSKDLFAEMRIDL